MKRFGRGFTLVELLIVIVIIGILAAISVVAYNGIQDRAKNAVLLSSFDATEKALRMYKEVNGSYPTPSDLPSGVTVACLSSNLTPNSTFPNASNGAGTCYMTSSTVYAADSPQLDSMLKSFISQIPDTSNYSVSVGGTDNIRGLLYTNTGLSTKGLEYVMKGTQSCGRGTPNITTINGVQFTICLLNLD